MMSPDPKRSGERHGGAAAVGRTRRAAEAAARPLAARLLGVAIVAGAGVIAAGCAVTAPGGDREVIADWTLSDLLDREGVRVLGSPRPIAGPGGLAVAFDGAGDAFFLDHSPLVGRDRFTIEVLMWPDADGPPEQRYLHFGEVNGDRVMLETRVTGTGQWYHDTYVHSGSGGRALIDPTRLHPADRWYHVAVVFDRGAFATYVNGVRELEGEVDFTPQVDGRTSIGVRQNEVSWFKGRLDRLRITGRALTPEEFLPRP